MRIAKFFLTSFLVGALSLGLAWAGAGVTPAPELPAGTTEVEDEGQAGTTGSETSNVEATLASLQEGEILAGASKVSIEPRPDDYGGTWETEGCKTAGEDAAEGLMHVHDFRVKWPEKPGCIYMGGYGIGPMNPITEWSDPYGLHVRAVAMSDGQETVVLSLLDGVYYFAEYKDMCDGCGAEALSHELGTELGLDPASFFFTATHSHTAPDFIGGWGGVPDWYMDQVADSIRVAVREAVSSMRPAVLETGEEMARARNSERRDFYRSAEEQTLTWLRLVEAGEPAAEPEPEPAPEDADGTGAEGKGKGKGKPSPSPTPEPTLDPEPDQPVTIATVGAFAAHPVTASASRGIADADFPGVFAQRVEERFGGTGVFFQSGLGNMSPRGNKVEMGEGLADLVPEVGSGSRITNPDVRVAKTYWNQPVTNSGLTGLGLPGFFDRKFDATPATVSAGKNSNRACRSASPVSVRTSVSAAKVGSLWITGAPGEVFSNLTNTIKERNPGGVTLPLGMVNDALGYIMQYFETDHAGRQILGFVGDPLAEYEDAYSLDHCMGEVTLESTLGLLNGL